MFVYVCSMWNWRAILQMRGASLAIQDGVQNGHRFLPINNGPSTCDSHTCSAEQISSSRVIYKRVYNVIRRYETRISQPVKNTLKNITAKMPWHCVITFDVNSVRAAVWYLLLLKYSIIFFCFMCIITFLLYYVYTSIVLPYIYLFFKSEDVIIVK